MTPLVFSILIGVLTLVCVAGVFFFWSRGSEGAAFACVVGAIIFGVATLVVPPVIYLSRHFGRVSCHTFATQTHRPTKFVLYNTWATGDCLTRTADGKWIPVSMLREFGEKP